MSADQLPSERFRCPACGFPIHNRAYPKCERCAQPLPAELLYSRDEIQESWKVMQARREEIARRFPDAPEISDDDD